VNSWEQAANQIGWVLGCVTAMAACVQHEWLTERHTAEVYLLPNYAAVNFMLTALP
jgi:hypothetical protein